jgi:serine/threonine protein kinase/Tol biopolymer transport system component
MGEVYRARDAKLGRDVALKVLPPAFALASDRLARFRREAQVLAALNHPNIAAIYGFEDDGPEAALVMEVVDGPTLAELIDSSGPNPDRRHGSAREAHGLGLADTLKIARQVAAAVEAAHAQGIIHRDLKPSNIKVRPDGTVKVLDFGLAKALAPDGGPASGKTAGQDIAASPTITSPAMTAMGVILGTAAYMAPEQAKGRPVDERADIWAFGCMVFEMVTGRRAFSGDDVSDTLANILKSEPDWSALPASTPSALRRLLRRCLSKDLAVRLPDIRVARLEIDEAMSPDLDATPVPAAPPTPAPTRSRWPFVALGVAVAALLGIIPLAVSHVRETPTPAVTVRFSVPPPDGEVFTPDAAFATVSPDGQYLVYRVAAPTRPPRLWLYALATQDGRELAGTERAAAAIWSPDSRAIAFVADGRLKRLDIAGSSTQTIAELNGMEGVGGSGSWSRDGTILLGNGTGGVLRVPAAGGEVAQLTTLDSVQKDAAHILPQFLPDGRRFLFTVLPGNVVRVGSLDSPAQSEVLKAGTQAWYAAPGYLMYVRQGTLIAQPFDTASASVIGAPVPVAEGVRSLSNIWGLFSTSENGVLVYESGEAVAGGRPVWVDRNGRPTPVAAEGLDNAMFPQLSPDGRRLAVILAGDVWVQDLAGRPPIRLTFDGRETPHFTPLWSPDGQRIVYESPSPSKLRVVPSDGSNATPTMLGPDGHFHPHGWSPDGRELMAARLPEFDIVALPMAGEAAPRDVIATPAREGVDGLSLSPDGRWIAYAANPTGRSEIWVRPYPGPGAPVRVSPNGGAEPVWARNGRELFYLDALKQQIMAVPIQSAAEFRFSPPVALFNTAEFVFLPQPPSYDIAADGRFLMIESMGRRQPGTRPLTVVLNWTEELKRATAGR